MHPKMIRTPLLFVLLSLLLGLPAYAGNSLGLLPTPKAWRADEGEMPLTAGSRIIVTHPSLQPLADILSDEIWMITKRKLATAEGEARPGDIVLKIDPTLRAEADILAVQKKDGKQQVVRTRDYAHTFNVTDTAVVTGWDYRAVCEGTATLLQAIVIQKDKVSLPKLAIRDWPHADYTGTMIDVARQWIPPDCIKFTIEACRFWKIRYLQIHFSDDHAYTFGSRAFPKLGDANWQISEGIVARCYTWEEMEELEAYAVARGVTIVPELETPGHYGAMARSMPDIFNGPGCMPMASEKLYEALDILMGEMCSIFKASPYFHIGCDEANIYGIGKTPEEQAYMAKHTLPMDDHPLNDAWQVYIMHVIRMKALCQKYGKIAIAWEGFAADKRVKDDLIVMTWYDQSFAAEMEQGGWNVITVPWFTGPIPTWNIFYANDHIYKRTTHVLGAQRPMWQMSEYSMLMGYVPGLCEREERTWGPNNDWGEESVYRARMASSTERMFNVAAPVKVVTEGGRILGVADGLKGWTSFTGVLTVKLEATDLEGSEIRYTLDGTDPTPKSLLYTGPLTMEKGFVLKSALFHEGRMLGACNRVKYEWRDISGWITEYQMANPYFREELSGLEVMDIPFAPETGDKVEWRRWKGQGITPWVCVFEPHEQYCCGYLRTKIWSPKAQNAMLLITSDDGVRAWLNDKVIHEENKVQSFTDAPDRVKVAFNEGWNTLQLKITQNDGGWGASVRVVAADGSEFEGLKVKAE